MLLSALTIDAGTLVASEFSNAGTGNIKTFAAANAGATIDLSDISVGVFTQAIENIATLRADNGASMSRLRFAAEEMAKQETNLVAAMGRITDVDIAAEHSDGEVQRLSSSLGRHAVPGELNDRRRTHAPEVSERMIKKIHKFKNRGSRLPQPEPDGTADKEVRGINQTKSEDNTMPLTINTNSAAASANYHLSRNQSALQKSLTRLSSGSRIVQPVDDAGGLAVSMKLESSIVRLGGEAPKKRPKRHFFLEVQDGVWLRRAKS